MTRPDPEPVCCVETKSVAWTNPEDAKLHSLEMENERNRKDTKKYPNEEETEPAD